MILALVALLKARPGCAQFTGKIPQPLGSRPQFIGGPH